MRFGRVVCRVSLMRRYRIRNVVIKVSENAENKARVVCICNECPDEKRIGLKWALEIFTTFAMLVPVVSACYKTFGRAKCEL